MSTTLVHYMYRPSRKALVEVGGKRMVASVLDVPRGVLVAYTDPAAPGHYLVGVSFCRGNDTFVKKTGTTLAKSRAITWWMRGHKPDFLRGYFNRRWFLKELEFFKARCDKVFKGATCSLEALDYKE